MKMIKPIIKFIGSLIAALTISIILFEYIVYDTEPSNYAIYISLLLYMQFFLKHD